MTQRRLVLSLFASCLALTGTSAVFAQSPGAQASDAPEDEPPGVTSEAHCPEEEKDCPEKKKKLTGSLGIAAGYTPDDRWILGASAVQEGLFGSRQSLGLSAIVSGRRQDFTLEYNNPSLFGSDRALDLELHTRATAHPMFSEKRVGGSFKLSRQLGYGVGVYTGYRLERVKSERLLPIALATEPGAQPSATSEVQIGAWRSGVTYDNGGPHAQRKQADFFVERSSSWIGSDYDLVRAGLKGELRHPLGPLQLHLAGGAEFVMGEHRFVPLAERLHFGGHSDVRGFGLGSVGSALGDVGKATGRAELEFPLVPSWGVSGALFYDTALLVGEHANDTASSWGGSLLVNTPIGPLRLDLALPMEDKASPSLLLTIGNSF